MREKISLEILLGRGYKSYPNKHRRYADHNFFQRRVTNQVGTKYFIDVYFYPGSEDGKLTESWSVEVNINTPHMTFEQHHVTDIVLAEIRIETFFVALECEYYEENL